MTKRAREYDDYLASMQDELRDSIKTLNELYHPVHPVSPDRITKMEARIEELRAAIAARRDELQAAAEPAETTE